MRTTNPTKTEAFGTDIETLLPDLTRFARVLTRNEDDAHDLVQDCVELLIGDLRRVPDVVALLVVPDGGAQLGEAVFGCRGHPEIGQSGAPSSGVPSSSPATAPTVR